MDVVGGAGISLGPRNMLGHPYIAARLIVTVEGANILTRSLMIFGRVLFVVIRITFPLKFMLLKMILQKNHLIKHLGSYGAYC